MASTAVLRSRGLGAFAPPTIAGHKQSCRAHPGTVTHWASSRPTRISACSLDSTLQNVSGDRRRKFARQQSVRGSFLRWTGGKDRAITIVRARSAGNARSGDDDDEEVRSTVDASSLFVFSACELGNGE